MSEFLLARESCEEMVGYNVLISEFENGTEMRRLKHANPIIGFRIKSPILTAAQMKEYRDFFIGQYGALDTFDFTSPFDGVKYSVRFVENSFKTQFQGGVFSCLFELRVVQ